MLRDGTNNHIDEYICTDYDGICMETNLDHGEIRGDCILSEEPCPQGKQSICVGNRIGSCMETGYPIYNFNDDCAFYCPFKSSYKTACESYCVELSTGEASCSYWPETCATEGEIRCASESLNLAVRCANGVWRLEMCPRDTQCADPGDAGPDAGSDADPACR